ncbi:hypothetical protein PF005_g22086 [Phytophthora fragariae]|uniref:Uncharacterized protein n=2 Tax=Phytophthora TaxID=4783 RepID=A0A6A3KD66_9STRA|nr:hypothetical protein PF003_g40333 [Phytophthora fragariae]KAE8985010.1 hypothetical protein PR002_g22768 [Phytophthora rubi]KAE8875830.1 hypothetical protein PF003_g40129 [Phytophthora fragariae]KAE8878086.1 hypothetical protein PF003_g37907 [Phytophthora fragariae]KAE8879381.1 hypothetical protein PF003_g36618 [Phytophthora fragariae]
MMRGLLESGRKRMATGEMELSVKFLAIMGGVSLGLHNGAIIKTQRGIRMHYYGDRLSS